MRRKIWFFLLSLFSTLTFLYLAAETKWLPNSTIGTISMFWVFAAMFIVSNMFTVSLLYGLIDAFTPNDYPSDQDDDV